MELDQKIINILVEQGDITAANAEEIRQISINSNTPILDILSKKRLVKVEKILQAKAKALNLAYITLLGLGISPEILNFIPEQVARKHKLIPFDYDKKTGKLSVAMPG